VGASLSIEVFYSFEKKEKGILETHSKEVCMTPWFDYNTKTLTNEKPSRQGLKAMVITVAGAALLLVLISGLLVSYLPSAYTSIVSAHRIPQQLPDTTSPALARSGSQSSLDSEGGKLLWRH
jgi:hypothetical protein